MILIIIINILPYLNFVCIFISLLISSPNILIISFISEFFNICSIDRSLTFNIFPLSGNIPYLSLPIFLIH